ncbi:hypothetical protein CQ14_32300 [Bradyrhizobium lablabi]|uniref:Uncharacterized protein n=1 Tax=Bradyrhizobium lablabi TaxID=722472 RepID=A0A0R3MU60_9BRAD|nr:hypothetical protein [Bradyrhizobium lablabi]KRR23306.1 hypothetical protein CQ14_32300 [Bradyrhizobium lablabi]
MGITVFVFDKRVAKAQADYGDWVGSEIAAAPKNCWDKPESSSPRLRKWFGDMCKTFPLIGETDPDDSYGTEYCFYRNVIDVVFASSIGEEGVRKAWKLAEKHGLRILIGDELLPAAAPRGKQHFHIPVLHGPKPDKPGVSPNICFVVFDPELTRVSPSTARKWALDQVETGAWSNDQSFPLGDRLSEWNDQLAARNLDSLISEMRFYRELIFVRVDQKNASSMVAPIMELSHRLGLPLQIYQNLAGGGP